MIFKRQNIPIRRWEWSSTGGVHIGFRYIWINWVTELPCKGTTKMQGILPAQGFVPPEKQINTPTGTRLPTTAQGCSDIWAGEVPSWLRARLSQFTYTCEILWGLSRTAQHRAKGAQENTRLSCRFLITVKFTLPSKVCTSRENVRASQIMAKFSFCLSSHSVAHWFQHQQFCNRKTALQAYAGATALPLWNWLTGLCKDQLFYLSPCSGCSSSARCKSRGNQFCS